MSPLGAVTTAEGRLKVWFVSPAMPGRPSVMSTFPSGLNLTTVWPLPSLPSASATKTLPSRSTWIACGNTNRPAPKLCTSRPEASNSRTGARLEAAQVLAPQRSNTHTLPLRSTSIALVDPQGLLSFAQPCSAENEVCSSGAPLGRIGPAHADTSKASVALAIATNGVGRLDDRSSLGAWNMFGFSATEPFRIESPGAMSSSERSNVKSSSEKPSNLGRQSTLGEVRLQIHIATK